MPSSVLTSIAGIAENSEATPGLWNSRFSDINANMASLAYFPQLSGEVGVVDVRYEWGRAERYGATGDAATDNTTFINNGISSVSALGLGRLAFGYGTFVFSAFSVTGDGVTLAGIGRSKTILRSSATTGDAIVVDLTGVTGNSTFGIDRLQVQQGVARTGKGYLVNIGFANNVDVNQLTIDNGGSSYVSGFARGIRFGEVNYGTVTNAQVFGSAADPFVVGLDVCQGVTGNRGNLTFVGGFLNRCNIGASIASGAGNLVNNVTFVGTKAKHSNGDGSVGFDVYTQAKNIILDAIQAETQEIGVRADSVTDLSLRGAMISSCTSVGVRLTNACDNVLIERCRIANNSSAGTGISLDATGHRGIAILNPSFSNCATNINNLSSTLTGQVVWATGGSTNYAGNRAASFDFADHVSIEKRLVFVGAGSTQISSDSIAAPVATALTLTPESGNTDSLGTIGSPGTGFGGTLLLLAVASGKTVGVLNTGNIAVPSVRTLNSTSDRLLLVWTGSAWAEVAFADNA